MKTNSASVNIDFEKAASLCLSLKVNFSQKSTIPTKRFVLGFKNYCGGPTPKAIKKTHDGVSRSGINEVWSLLIEYSGMDKYMEDGYRI